MNWKEGIVFIGWFGRIFSGLVADNFKIVDLHGF